jgi:hypothetical protein
MNVNKNNIIRVILKKTAAATAVLLLVLNPFFAGKNNLKLFIDGFEKVSAQRQNALDISMQINKAANAVGGLFALKSASSITYTPANNQKSAPAQTGAPVRFFTEIKNPADFAAGCSSGFLQAKNLNFCVMPAAGAAGDSPDGGRKPLISYFIIMLLFFASSRKVYAGIIEFKNIGMPAYF